MHGMGKGGKGLGAIALKRHKEKSLKPTTGGLTRPAIARLARRGGVKRLNGLVYEETRSVLRQFLHKIIGDAVNYADYARRTTIQVSDVLMALSRNGKTLYGFGND